MPQQLLDIQFGYPSPDGVITYVGKSLSNANILVTLHNGKTDELINMTEIGTDSGVGGRDRAGYHDNGSFSGVERFAFYRWTAEQNGNTIKGSFTTNPTDRDDFCIWAKTCEQSSNPYAMWKDIRAYSERADALPVVGMIHVDDHGYWDSTYPAGIEEYTSTITSGVPFSVFNYAVCAFNDAGLYDGDAYAEWGYDEDRLWGRRNINLLPTWGDHDTGINEMGWNISPALYQTDLPVAGERERFERSTSVWNAVMKPLQPPAIAGAVANGDNSWSGTLGCLEIMSLDGISKATGDGSSPANMAAPTDIYGDPQIENFLDAVEASTQPFKLMPMNYSIKYNDVKVGTNASLGELANNPLKDYRLDEFAKLFTESGNTKKSLMDNPKTNGLRGHLATLHGDAHIASVVAHRAAAYTGNLPESFLSIGLCGFTDKGGAPVTDDIEVGYIYDGSEVKYCDKLTEYDSFCCRIEVFGSKELREVHFVFLGAIGNGDAVELWTEKLVETRGMNETHDIDADLVIKGSTLSGGDLL